MEDLPWPDQPLEGDAAYGGRFELKEFSVLAMEDLPWPDQPLEADEAKGGRFELKEDDDLGVLAQVD